MAADNSTMNKLNNERIIPFHRRPQRHVAPYDPKLFEPSAQPVSQEFHKNFPTLVLDIPIEIRAPRAQEFFQSHPDDSYQKTLRLLKWERFNEYYFVNKSLHVKLHIDIHEYLLVTCVNRSDTVFLWPVRLTDKNGGKDPWALKYMQVLLASQGQWVRKTNNKNDNGDTIHIAKYNDKPRWPDITFEELLELAIQDFIINDINHPAAKDLLGKAS